MVSDLYSFSIWGSISGAFVEAPAIAKIVAFFFSWLLLWAPIAVPLAIALKWRPPQPVTPGQKLPLLASLYLIVPFLLWGLAKLEGFPFDDYGLVWNQSLGISLALGIGLAILGLGLFVAIQTGLGWIAWRSPTRNQVMAESPPLSQSNPIPALNQVAFPLFCLALWISWTEELVFSRFFWSTSYNLSTSPG